MEQINKDNISEINSGLHTDTSPQNQPKGTYRFALNTINETNDGDENFRSNEESNESCYLLTPGFIPIGKEYIGGNEIVIFSVSSDDTISEIGILKNNCEYEVHVNDEDSTIEDKLRFSIKHQIQCTYRLRRGCERTIYFTDNNTKPKYYNFDKSNEFKNQNGTWNKSKFSLIKNVQVYPEIQEVTVEENVGNLLPGSYTILLQYLDEELNGTKFIEIINNVNIINDSLLGDYSEIQGSTGLDVKEVKSLPTTKAIKIKFSQIDTNYAYFRLAIVQYTNGTGLISKVVYTANVSTKTPEIIYSGLNASENGTIEEIELVNSGMSLDKVGSIEQIDNRLILANVSGQTYNYCNLQKYASKIKADAIIKDIQLTTVEENHNSKNPLVNYYGLGHQPGDIYSYGVVYVFKDLTESPPYHIPGKNNSLPETLTFTNGNNVRAMRSSENKNLSESYINNNSCGVSNYWGVDSEGVPLVGTKVRHHRFPTRDEMKIGFVKKVSNSNITEYKQLQLELKGILKESVFCDPIEDKSCPDYYLAPSFRLILRYKLNGVATEFKTTLINEINSDRLFFTNVFLSSDVITDIELFYEKNSNTPVEIAIPLDNNNVSDIQDNDLTYHITSIARQEDDSTPKYEAPILGIKFSNIEIPSIEEAGGIIIGYKIVRQERRDEDKTIMDSAVILPMSYYNQGQGDFISATMNAPILDGLYYPYLFSPNTINILSLQYKFAGKTMDGFTSIEEVGKYKQKVIQVNGCMIENVDDESSANSAPDELSKHTKDDDGFTFKQLTKCVEVEYKPSDNNKFFVDNTDSDLFDLDAIESATHSNEVSIITNLSNDNKSLILSKKNPPVDLNSYKQSEIKYPYVYIKKQNDFFYSNFRTNPYYAYDNAMHTSSICESYHGDTHITPLRHSTHVYGYSIQARRLLKQSFMDYVWAALAIIVAVVITIYTWGAGTAPALALVAASIAAIGASFAVALNVQAAHIKIEEFAKAYTDRWNKGLNFTLFDVFYQQCFYEPDIFKPKQQLHYADDTHKWYGEVLGDFWFETTLNASLRVPINDNTVNYLKPLKPFTNNRPDKYAYLCAVERVVENLDGVGPFRRYKDYTMPFDGPEESYFARKILRFENFRWLYNKVSTPVLFMLNNDHNVNKGIIKYYALSQTYDCCSDCQENFPHRWHWSEPSFQEELSDNYRVFLPNNYKDITGETGEITNVFKINNDLFIHTREALYQIPRNFQERVTDQLVSFIGTGSFGEIPERKILDDDNGSSAGCNHKWGTIKTPHGVFFPSENENKIYQFQGTQLKPISDIGISNYFESNMKIKNKIFNQDNPSNPFGTGFISTYDSKKERIIFTKKDYLYSANMLEGNDYEMCIGNGQVIIFPNISATINTEAMNGWYYNGIENCKLLFTKNVERIKTEIRNINVWHPAIEINTQIWHDPATIINNDCDFLNSIIVNIANSQTSHAPIKLKYTKCNGEIISIYDTAMSLNVNSSIIINDCVKRDAPITLSYLITGSEIDYTIVSKDIINFCTTTVPGYYTTSTETTPGYWEQEPVETIITYTEKEYKYIEGNIIEDFVKLDNSWTLSYSLKENKWVSWHSYLPNFYINTSDNFYSWIYGNDTIWKHNKKGYYQTFYNNVYPFILDYISISNPLNTKIWEYLKFLVEVKKFNKNLNEFVDIDNTFFNNLIIYNSRQCSGLLNVKVKNNKLTENYLFNQINNSFNNEIIVDRNERDWTLNNLRDIRTNYNEPIFISDLTSLQNNYFIDKIINNNAIDYNKDWTELESFRDKYLGIRLIFDNFANDNKFESDNINMIMNFSNENQTTSFR